MNIKSLLIGSAALATVSTGAQAADAIVMPAPEPMEYVRICDVYGTGFFYIPGTETCLKLSGYMRYEIQYNTAAAGGLTKLARFKSSFDVRSDTEVGTIRGFASINYDWQWGTRAGVAGTPAAPAVVTGYGVDVGIDQAYIQIIRGSHQWLFGREAKPYARMQGYGFFTQNGGSYGFGRTSEISYTFAGSNGFNFWAALVTDADANFIPDVELGMRFDRGWGSLGLAAGFDSSVGAFGAKAWTRFRFGNSGVSGAAAVIFSSTAGVNAYGATIPGGTTAAPLSVLAGLQAKFSPKVTGNLHAQWFSTGQLDAALNLDFTVARGFNVIPEVRFNTVQGLAAVIRLDRSF